MAKVRLAFLTLLVFVSEVVLQDYTGTGYSTGVSRYVYSDNDNFKLNDYYEKPYISNGLPYSSNPTDNARSYVHNLQNPIFPPKYPAFQHHNPSPNNNEAFQSPKGDQRPVYSQMPGLDNLVRRVPDNTYAHQRSSNKNIPRWVYPGAVPQYLDDYKLRTETPVFKENVFTPPTDFLQHNAGICPRASGKIGPCFYIPGYHCFSDSQCAKGARCCPEGCGRVCKQIKW